MCALVVADPRWESSPGGRDPSALRTVAHLDLVLMLGHDVCQLSQQARPVVTLHSEPHSLTPVSGGRQPGTGHPVLSDIMDSACSRLCFWDMLDPVVVWQQVAVLPQEFGQLVPRRPRLGELRPFLQGAPTVTHSQCVASQICRIM